VIDEPTKSLNNQANYQQLRRALWPWEHKLPTAVWNVQLSLIARLFTYPKHESKLEQGDWF